MREIRNPFRILSRIAIVSIGVGLVIAIGYLTVTQYRSQIAIRQTALKDVIYDSERRATALGYFFSEQRDILKELAESRELSGYFENKALGMSMEYGLQASIISTGERFDRIRQAKKLGDHPMYSRIVFIDADGQLLNDSHPPGQVWHTHRNWKQFISPADREPVVFCDKEESELRIIISAPCFFKEKYAGQVVAWISFPDFYRHFFEWKNGSERLPVAILFHDEYLHIPDAVKDLIPGGSRAVPSNMQAGQPYPLPIHGRNSEGMMAYAVLVPVKGTPFSLMTFIPPTDQFDFRSPQRLLYTTSGLALLIIAGMFFLVRLNTHNVLLKNHLEETLLSEEAVDQKNRELAEEIRERKNAEAHIRKLSHGIENSATAVFITDISGFIEYVNAKFTAVTGYRPEEAIGQKPSILKSELTPVEVFSDLWSTILRGDVWRGELQNRRKSGEVFWSFASISPLRNERNEITNFIANIEDINDRKNAETTIEKLAYYDPLTGLPNRRLLQDRLSLSMKRSHRHVSSAALLYLDLDRFKNVNDSLGHPAGDLLLQRMAERFLDLLRDDDLVCRLGGDEFAIILNDIKRDDFVAQVAEKLISAACSPIVINDAEVVVTVSIGIALYPKDADTGEILAKHADIALYNAKAAGKNTFRFYSDEQNRATHDRLGLEGALRHALERNELMLQYQPKVSLAQGTTIGVEALLRWHTVEFGQVSPIRFIPLAEESKLILPIGEWVLRTACSQQVLWQRQGLDLTMAVNLSAVQFNLPTLIERISAIIDETGIQPERLELELTESALVSTPEEAALVLGRLRNLGVSVAIDDFGTGYSSLSYLKTFPVNVLKIDRSFVRDLAHNSGDRAIARSIVDLAGNLGMKTVAEGVETIEQSHILAEIGCDCLQGFLYSRPVPAEQLPETIKLIKMV